MSSSLRRGALAASAIVFSIASLAACGAGNDSATLQVKPDNAATSVGAIKVQNAVVITQPDLQSTGPAVISATVFNTGTTPQTLQNITVAGTNKSAELSPAKGQSLTIPAGGRLIIGGKDNASAVLASSRESVQDGNAQKVTFTFSETGDVSLRAFVVPAESYFTNWGPSEIPTATAPAGAAANAKPSKSASKGATDEPTAGATETPADTTAGDAASASSSATPSGN